MGDSKGYGRKNLVVLGYDLVHKMAQSQSYLTTRLKGVGEWFSKLPEFPYTSYLRTGLLNENPSHLSPKKLLQKKTSFEYAELQLTQSLRLGESNCFAPTNPGPHH